MAKKASNKDRPKRVPNPGSHSRKQCEDSLKNFCEPGFRFVDEIHIRAQTITPLLKEILDFRPQPRWR